MAKSEKMNFKFNDYGEFIEESKNNIKNLKADKKFAVMYLDITDFKLVNDFYSFEEGDRFLYAFMEVLKNMTNTVSCGRVFSDHFLRMFSYENLNDICMEIDKSVKIFNEFLKEQQLFHPSTTVYIACGLCELNGGEDSLVAAIDQANMARKTAKEHNKTSIVWFDMDMMEEIRSRKRMESDILKALNEERFIFYLQPKVNLYTGKIIGAEALARLVKEDGTIISPGSFVPIMELNESIVDLDFKIYRQVCLYLKEKIENGKPLIPISVNMSRAHLRFADTAKKVHELVQSYDIPPYLLEFELTESIFLDDYTSARNVMQELRKYGYKLAIDDFGTGYSGIRVWQDLEFDVLKLDRQFTFPDVQKSNRNDIIIPRFVEISNDLKVMMLCEGVETLEQCSHMKNLGCCVAQGYYFSKPVSREDFDSNIEEYGLYFNLPWTDKKSKNESTEYIDLERVSEKEIKALSRSIFHVIPGGFAGYDKASGKLLFASDGFVSMTGYSREELFSVEGEVRESWEKLLEFQYVHGMIYEEMSEAIKRDKNFSSVYTIKVKSGEKRYIHIYGGLITSSEWGTYILCNFFDETKQETIEAQADQLEQQLSGFVQSLHGGIAKIVLNKDLHIEVANDGYYNLTGYTREESLLPPFSGNGSNIILEEDMPGLLQDIDDMLAGKKNSSVYRIRKKDGTVAWRETYFANIYKENDKVIGEAIFLDITDEREWRIEQEKRHSNSRMRAFGKLFQVDVWEYDIVHEVLFLSQTENLFNVQRDNGAEISLSDFIELGVIHPDDQEAFLKTMKSMKYNKKADLILKAKFTDKQFVDVEITMRASEYENEEAVRAVGIVRHIQESGEEVNDSHIPLEPGRKKGFFDMKGRTHNLKKITIYLSIAIIFSGILLAGIFQHYRELLETEFDQLMEENLTSYIKTQQVEVQSFNADVKSTLEAVKVVAESADSVEEEIERYLAAFGKEQDKYNIEYKTIEELKNELTLNKRGVTEEFYDNFKDIISGKEVFSNVRYSSRLDGYFYSIAEPVQKNGEVVGVLRTIIKADSLVKTKQQSSKASVFGSFLIKGNGTFVPIRKENEKLADSLREELEKKHVSEEDISRAYDGLLNVSDIYVQSIGGKDSRGLYISIVPLGYNNLYIIDFAQESGIYNHSDTLMKQMIQTSVIILLLIVFIMGMLFLYVNEQKRKENFQAKKYMVLAQFSDTVMFQYNYHTDTGMITPNAEKKFLVHGFEKEHYLKDMQGLMNLHHDDWDVFKNIIMNPNPDGKVYRVNMRIVGKNGEYIWCAYQYQYIYESTHPIAVIGKFTDISEQKEREDRLRERANIDGLTDIYNKSAGEYIIKEQMGESGKGFLFVFDVDNFKKINDDYGHMQGDNVLTYIGKILKERFRSCDVVCRVGGDEFVAYMSGTDNTKIAEDKSRGILNDLNLYTAKYNVEVTVSIGVSIYPKHGNNFEQLFSAADEAMYEAKHQGKNRYKIHD